MLCMVCLVQNNIAEIRTDALKLLAMFKRPTPRAAATIGAWLNIFQVIDVQNSMSVYCLPQFVIFLTSL